MVENQKDLAPSEEVGQTLQITMFIQLFQVVRMRNRHRGEAGQDGTQELAMLNCYLDQRVRGIALVVQEICNSYVPRAPGNAG